MFKIGGQTFFSGQPVRGLSSPDSESAQTNKSSQIPPNLGVQKWGGALTIEKQIKKKNIF